MSNVNTACPMKIAIESLDELLESNLDLRIVRNYRGAQFLQIGHFKYLAETIFADKAHFS